MRYENKTEPRMKKPQPTMPQVEGFYWAKWRIPEDGTADEEHFVMVDKWEVVEVHDDFDDDSLRVFVAGVERTKSIENFVWAKPVQPIPYPEH